MMAFSMQHHLPCTTLKTIINNNYVSHTHSHTFERKTRNMTTPGHTDFFPLKFHDRRWNCVKRNQIERYKNKTKQTIVSFLTLQQLNAQHGTHAQLISRKSFFFSLLFYSIRKVQLRKKKVPIRLLAHCKRAFWN